MDAKGILYIVVFPIIVWALNSINITNIFKKNKYAEARILYIVIAMSLTYLVVNFFYDIFIYTKYI